MNIVGKFEKVSFEQYYEDIKPLLPDDWTDEEIKQSWEEIELPVRATSGSAGYDFISPVGFTLFPGASVVVPTGIRVRIDDGWMLMCAPRSGLGFKYGMALANTVGIIDADYYYSDNEGHIMLKVYAKDKVEIEYGQKFAQGIFIPFGVTTDDNTTTERNGGLGSTDEVSVSEQ